jgi:hypothetical protein
MLAAVTADVIDGQPVGRPAARAHVAVVAEHGRFQLTQVTTLSLTSLLRIGLTPAFYALASGAPDPLKVGGTPAPSLLASPFGILLAIPAIPFPGSLLGTRTGHG